MQDNPINKLNSYLNNNSIQKRKCQSRIAILTRDRAATYVSLEEKQRQKPWQEYSKESKKETAQQSQGSERESSQERNSQLSYQRLQSTDTSDYLPSETETVTDDTNQLIQTLDDDNTEEAIRNRMEELYISRKEAQVHDEMLRLLQEKERLDQIKKEVEKKLYQYVSPMCNTE